MCTTYSGRLLMPTNFGIPTPTDIAVQLGRLPRFAGATRLWPWSVLHHIAVCMKLVEGLSGDFQSLVLLHDAEECATGDVPTTWKNPDLRASQDALSHRIFRNYAQSYASEVVRMLPKVKEVDLLALVAEMHVLGPPRVLQHSGLDNSGLDPDRIAVACDVVSGVYRAYDNAHDCQSPDGRLVQWFLRTMVKLMPGSASAIPPVSMEDE